MKVEAVNMKVNHYYLCSGSFNVDVSGFGIHSFHRTGKENTTRFIRAGQTYATMDIQYEVGEKPGILKPHDPLEEYREDKRTVIPLDEESSPYESTKGCYLRYREKSSVTFTYGDDVLAASVIYTAEEEYLEQKLVIENKTLEKVSITDLSVFLPTNSVFVWEEKSGEKVIGHHFIGGHGSFSMVKRCDGAGPYLLMIPQKDTSFEYWELEEGRFARIEEVEGTFCNKVPETYTNLFIHSVKAAEKAVREGTRLRHQATEKKLPPGGKAVYSWKYLWVNDDIEARDMLVKYGLWDVISLPGFTVPNNMRVSLALRSIYEDGFLQPEFPDKTDIFYKGCRGAYQIYEIDFHRLGENQIKIWYDNHSKWMALEYFVTEPLDILLEKRAAFLTGKQCRDTSKWYRGLLCEWDNEEKICVTPEKHDRLNGWFIYAICSDDPGLSKPAFLSSKIAEQPVQEQVDAMDDYIEFFVWGGLQLRDDEQYPYGIYGIPNWYVHRYNTDPGVDMALLKPSSSHIWRIYDYPHIILMYFNMYRVASNYPQIKTRLTAMTYLERAFRTATAMFTWPLAVDGWSADTLGLYNECCIPSVISALRENEKDTWADELERHWERKARYFIRNMKDLFVSEIAVDTTNFESSYALAEYAAEKAAVSSGFCADDKDVFARRNRLLLGEVMDFMEKQKQYNMSCRGTIEPAYYWYGSDYRGKNSYYTLSYMSQMGGWSLLEQALWYEEEPFALLRLGYGSALSSWALLNSGNESSNFGYWFPGIENDGAAGGGFEPAPYGVNWLSMKHHRGCWPYSCEIDLGFSGGIRCMSTILVKDPIFGWTALGGRIIEETESQIAMLSLEAVRRRLHVLLGGKKLHFIINRGKFAGDKPVIIAKDLSFISLTLDCSLVQGNDIFMKVENSAQDSYSLEMDKEKIEPEAGKEITFRWKAVSSEVNVVLKKIK